MALIYGNLDKIDFSVKRKLLLALNGCIKVLLRSVPPKCLSRWHFQNMAVLWKGKPFARTPSSDHVFDKGQQCSFGNCNRICHPLRSPVCSQIMWMICIFSIQNDAVKFDITL